MLDLPFNPTEILGDGAYYAHPDEYAIYYLLNDLFSHEPERFGSEETRQQVIQEIKEIEDGYYYGIARVADIFDKYHITPLEGIRVIHVASNRGTHRMEKLTDTAATYMTTPTYQLFYATPAKGELNLPDYAHATELVKNGKFDYVITGNVVNEPDNISPLDTLAASAILLKKGGLAMHLAGYSEIPGYRKPIYPRITNQELYTDKSLSPPKEYNARIKWRHLSDNTGIAQAMGQSFEGEVSYPGKIVLMRQMTEIDALPDFAKKEKPPTSALDSADAHPQGPIQRTGQIEIL